MNDDDVDEDIERLIEAHLEGSLDSAGQQPLEAWLRAHPSHMRLFVQSSMRDQMLRDVARLEFLTNEIQGVSKGDKAPRGVFELSRRLFTKRAAAFVTALAACLLICFFTYRSVESGAEQTAEVKVERTEGTEAYYTVAMVQESDTSLRIGDRIGAESIEFQRGIVRMQFDDGVEVTLQGPAYFESISLGKTRLHSGLLAATVPPGAEGFQVDTPSAQIVDLGTAFGIEQSPNGVSKVSVFDGEVEVISRSEDLRRLLTEGQSVRLDSSGDLQETDFETRQFEKLWPAASGIVGSSGAFEFAPQWPRMLRRVESDTRIFVLPEGYAQELDQPCPVDLSTDALEGTVIPIGHRVQSYLLQFNPVDSDEGGLGPGRRSGRRITGSVTFERPIVGVITQTATLKTTDDVFSLRRAGMMPGRGLEERPPRLADKVSFSEDGRTLTLDLFVVNRLSDHVRVIIDARLNEPEQH
ncbi:MAG: FecR family protein [Planctomycetota bacterium]